MKTKVVLFDLDGTLLPMNQDAFVKNYFGGLAKSLIVHGYEPQKLIDTIWKGTGKMIENKGDKTNENTFWDTFISVYGEDALKDEPYFDEFYHTAFDDIKNVCGFNPKSVEVVRKLKELGFRVALATNPIFPPIATKKRIEWAGLLTSDFEFITTYDNSSFCKPNVDYYKEITHKIGVNPEECLMVGNDVDDDMVAKKIGMKVFLLTDCLINKSNLDASLYPQGNLDDLMKFVTEKILTE